MTKKKNSLKASMVTIASVVLAIIMILSGVGIYLTITKKDKTPVEVGPLDFSVDAWDGTISGVSFNEAYAGRSVKTKTINSASAFAHFVNEVNNGNTFENYTVYLNSNIDLKNKTINPIGTFKGTFDGGHYTILNAKVKGKALFDHTENATIKNIGLYNSNCNLINTAVNTNIENTFVRLGSGNLVNEFISNNGTHEIKNSFVDSSAENLINKLDTNNSQENEVTISNCYYTAGNSAVKEKVGEAYLVEDKVIKPTNTNSFIDWSYSPTYTLNTDWCNYDYLEGSKKLDFVYPLQSGFVKVFLTGSCYESVMVAGDTVIDSTNLAHAFTEADKEEIAEVNLLVEKIFMEAQAEVTTTNVTINALKDTTIIRGENNTDSMFVSKGDSKIVLGGDSTVMLSNVETSQSSGDSSASLRMTNRSTAPTITIDGNRDYIEKNELESGALVVSYGGQVEIGENVVIKNNVNNSEVGYGGAVLLYNTNEVSNIQATFENCHSEKSGGAVAIIGSQVGEIGSFYNCSAKGNGGAIYVAKEIEDETSLRAMHTTYGNGMNVRPTEVIEDDENFVVTITGNEVYENNSAQNGGFLYTQYNVVIEGSSTFINNTASQNGGAICWDWNGYPIEGKLTITGNPTFVGNQSTNQGGAVSVWTVEISGNPTFENNTTNGSSEYGGGAIHADGNIDISGDPIFSGNSAPNGYGGAIGHLIDGTITIAGNPTFEENSAKYGGAIADWFFDAEYSGHITFINNTASQNGGAIWVVDDTTISGDATFTNNTASQNGGAISAGTITISGDATFSGNEAMSGGAIYADDLTISGNPTFLSNTIQANDDELISGNGGAICASSVEISGDATFTGNTAKGWSGAGGAIYASGSVSILGASLFQGNSAASYSNGGAICATGDVTISSDSVFGGSAEGEGNLAQSGGAIYSNANVTVLGDAIFTSNSALATGDSWNLIGGGAIYADDVTISGNATFTSNTAAENGGAICANEGDVIISGNPVFGGSAEGEGNTAKNGGAIYTYQGSFKISGNATFIGNTGGACYAYLQGWDSEISGDATFKNNSGGAIYSPSLKITGNPIFTSNQGGALNVEGNLVIEGNPIFKENSAEKGGAIYHSISGGMEITGKPVFENNTATDVGGAIYDEYASTSEYLGAAIFKGNSATKGGAMYLTYGGDNNPVTISGDAQFINNSSTENGGAIWADRDVTISGDAAFTGNSASEGGAIDSNGNVIITSDATFTGNSSDGNGGAIRAAGDVVIGGKLFTGEEYVTSQISAYDDTFKQEWLFMLPSLEGDKVLFTCGNATISISSTGDILRGTDNYATGAIKANTLYKLVLATPNYDSDLTDDSYYYLDWNISEFQTSKGIIGDFETYYPSESPYQDIYMGAASVGSDGIVSEGSPIYLCQLGVSSNNEVVFNGNVAESSGGAIYAGKHVTITKNAEFKDNESRNGDGGAIYGFGVALCGDILFANNRNLNENDIDRKGGAICAFGGAYAPRGDGVYINGNVTFSNNYSGCEGGAIYTDDDVTILGETIFRNNSARYAGGAIGALYAVTLSGKTQFIANHGGANFGGAMFTHYGNVTMSGVTEFIDNQTDTHGGAIYVPNASQKVEILGNALFENNRAGEAGAVAYVGGNLVITQEVMLRNNNGERSGEFYDSDFYCNGEITLGADILWATNYENRNAISIPESKWIKVTAQLTKRIPVYKNGAAHFTGSNVQSYIFEDQTTEGLQDCGIRFPFECVTNSYYYDVNYNNLKAKYGVLNISPGNYDCLDVESLALDLETESTGSFTYRAEKDLLQYFTITSSNPSVVQIVDYKNYVGDGGATCNIKTIAPGTAEITIQGGYNEGSVDDEIVVYVTVSLRDSGVEIGDMPSGLQYSQTASISYKAQTAGTFEIISLNSVAEVLSYSEHVVAGHNYTAFIKATGVGDAEIMFKFTPDSEYYASEEATYTFSVEQYVLPEVSNVRFLPNSYNGAYSILTWDSLSTSDINVRYEFAVRDNDLAYSDCIYYSSTNKIDIYDYLMTCAQEIVSNEGECYIMIEFINAYADNCLSSNTQCSYVSIHFNYISIDCSAIKDKVSAIKIDGKTYRVTDDDNRFNLYFFEGQTSEIELILTGEAISDSYIIDEWAGVTNTKINSTTTSVRYIGGDSFAGRLTPTLKKKTFNVQVNVDNATYGTVTKTSVDIDNGSSITIDGNALTIGDTTIHAHPAQATAEYSYEFAGWVGVTDGSTLSKDLVVYAMFTRSINQYTIKFEAGNANGTVDVASVDAPYGTLVEIQGNVITIGATTITATGNGPDINSGKDWVFDYWEGVISVVDGNATIKAYFKGVDKTVNVTIKTNNAEYGLISRQGATQAQFEIVVGYGFTVHNIANELNYGTYYYNGVPIASDAQYTYTFAGWFVDGVAFETSNIIEDTIIEARFERSINDYTITINSNNEAYGTVTLNKIENVVYGTKIKATDNLLVIGEYTVVANVADISPRYEYKFNGWTIANNTVQGDMEIIANFEQVERVFKVTVVVNDENGGTISGYTSPITATWGTTILVKDNTITIGETTITATANENYRFVEWQGVVGAVNNDITITAVFVEQVTITFHDDMDQYTISHESVTVDVGTILKVSPTGYEDVGPDGPWYENCTLEFGDIVVTITNDEYDYFAVSNFFIYNGEVANDETPGYFVLSSTTGVEVTINANMKVIFICD